IWREARRAYAVDPSRATLRRLEEIRPPEKVFPAPRAGAACILRALRPLQWSKNLLLAVPLVLAHQTLKAESVALAMLAFSLVASAGYVINDLLDLAADRAHPEKRRRPFASGAIPVAAGPAMILVLLGAGFTLAWTLLPPPFRLILGIYFLLTVVYSVSVKRKLLVDVLLLAGLYTLRILAGGAAVDVAVSKWLLAFSVFLFLSLAFAKRYGELRSMAEEERLEVEGRGYRVEERDIVMNVGAMSGLLSVLVFSLYINLSEEVTRLYLRADVLWLACPILLYWILRIWFLARRGRLSGDPVTFTLTDGTSYILVALVVLVFIIAGPVD
ncbi:MAG: UbiA family prenyltransferase, partial [Planctomycetota bacterium]